MKASKLLSWILISAITTGATLAQANYCAAIRGNGELMPAHWGAMSSIVEEQGLPSAMAGGSSASITMFLLESLSLNPIVKTNSERALLIKSFQGYFEALTQTEEGKTIQALLADKEAFKALFKFPLKLDQALKSLKAQILIARHLDELNTVMQSKDLREAINPEFVTYVKRTLALSERGDESTLSILKFRTNEISTAIKNFGKFDSQTDKTLFVRPGLISFAKVARLMGDMGDFYAGYNNDSAEGKKVEQSLRNFLDLCTPNSQNLSWRQLNEQRPACRQMLVGAVLTYRQTNTRNKSRIHESVGAHIPALPTTSVLTGASVDQYTKLFIDYQTTTNPNFGDFQVNPSELRFGYWGDEASLQKIAQQFKSNPEFQQDPKSQKFLSLGNGPWLEVLSTSPAEPGLSRITALSRTMLSAGGWSDLHPVNVLKALGCENIIYVTRKGEESRFAQGVFRRLMNADDATMSAFYSMENSQSSIMRSQKNAAAIKCTDWNSFDVTKDLNGLVEEAMRAPMTSGPVCK